MDLVNRVLVMLNGLINNFTQYIKVKTDENKKDN